MPPSHGCMLTHLLVFGSRFPATPKSWKLPAANSFKSNTTSFYLDACLAIPSVLSPYNTDATQSLRQLLCRTYVDPPTSLEISYTLPQPPVRLLPDRYTATPCPI